MKSLKIILVYFIFAAFNLNAQLSVPTLQTPEDVTVGVNLVPSFTWTDANSSVTYQLQIADDTGFNNIISDEYGISNKYFLPSNSLASYKKYFWRVKARQGANSSEWSNVSAFRTKRLYPWLRGFGNVNSDIGYGIASDASGNIYITGEFSSSVSFGGGITIASNGLTDIYVAKFDNNGTCLWAFKAGGPNADFGNNLIVDNDGNVYVTGIFNGSATFTGSINLTGYGNDDVFLAKFNSQGVCQWAVKAGGVEYDMGYSVGLDSDNNIYICGYYQSTASFGNSISLTSNGGPDLFLARYNSTGVCQWAIGAGDFDSDYCIGLTVSPDNNIYVTGTYVGTVNFGNSNTLSSEEESPDIFLAKYNTTGFCQWVKSAGGVGYDLGYSITLDNNEDLYITGSIQAEASFGNGVPNLTSYGNRDIFVAKYNQGGNCLWANHAGGTDRDSGYDIYVAQNGTVYVTGYYTTSAVFKNDLTLNAVGGKDIFIGLYNSINGNCITAYSAGGNQDDYGWGLQGASGDPILVGSFKTNTYFGYNSITSAGNNDIILAKIFSDGLQLTQQTLNLNQGWNLISSNIEPFNPFLESIFANISDKVVILKNGIGQTWFPLYSINSITAWNINHGYQLFLSQAADLTIKGAAIEPENTQIPLNQGWNMFSYLRNGNMDIETALAGILDKIVIVKSGTGLVYFPAYFINSLNTLSPGQGYQIFMNESSNLIYPANTAP